MKNNLYYIKRHIFDKVAKHLSNKEMTVIIGPRQVGKTVLLKQLREFLLTEKKITPENIYNFNLDIIFDRTLFDSQTDFIKFVKQRSVKSKIYVFIDEAQKINNAGVFLKGVFDSDLNAKFVLTGSSALEIKAKIQESLTGRKRLFHLLPFSLLEIINYKNPALFSVLAKNKKIAKRDNAEVLDILEDYCLYGGYPQVVLADDVSEKISYLGEIFTSYIERDVIGFLRIENENNFIKLVKLLAAQIGRLIVVGELSVAVNTDRYTIDRYLASLEKTFINYRLKPHFKNARQEIVKAEKSFFIDNGLRNFGLNKFQTPFIEREDSGELLENMIFKELLVLKHEKNFNLKFWRTKQGAEVDFVVENGLDILPIEVKSNLHNDNIATGLVGFISSHNPPRALVVNLKYQGKRIIGKTEVYFILPYELGAYF